MRKLTVRQQVLVRAATIGATVELLTSGIDRRSGNKLEVIAPDGYTFNGLTGLICHSWADALERLVSVELEPDPNADDFQERLGGT